LVAQLAVFICFGAYGLGFDFVPRCHIFLSKAAGVVSLVSSISPFPRSFLILPRAHIHVAALCRNASGNGMTADAKSKRI
jgi:hypothetical protein